MSTCYQNPVVRDGTSQQQRLVKALLPEFVSVDERNFSDLKKFVLDFSKMLRFYSENDESESLDWYAFFDKKINEKGNTDPQYALFQAFLELFKVAQNDLNSLTKRHLDFFYKEVLKLKEKAAVPDQVFIIFELAKHVSTKGHLIKEGTRLKAGKDPLGNNVFYEAKQDLVVNKAQVAELKGLFKDLDKSLLYASPIANSSDGLGAGIETDSQSWIPFGSADRPDTLADIGFAIASPILHLAEGIRTVRISVTFDGTGTLDHLDQSDIEQAFDLYLSGKKEWLRPSEFEFITGHEEFRAYAAKRVLKFVNSCQIWKEIAGEEPARGLVFDSPTSGYGDQVRDYDIGKTVAKKMLEKRAELPNQQFSSLDEIRSVDGIGIDKINDLLYSFSDTFHATRIVGNTLHLTRTLLKDKKAVVGYNQEKLLDPLDTQLPVAKLLLNNKQSSFIYDELIDLNITKVHVEVDVDEVKNLVVQNDQTVMDPAKTILPFGIIPVPNGSFYIGNQEVFQKKLSELKIHINWHGLPEEDFGCYYEFYPGNEDVSCPNNETNQTQSTNGTTIKRNNGSFVADLTILDKKEWKSVGSDRQLFEYQSLTDPVKDSATVEALSDLLDAIDRDPSLEPFDTYDHSSQKGFARLTLGVVDFGHKDYQIAFTRRVLQNLKEDLGDASLFPNEPYNPQINGVSIDYKSFVTIDLKSPSEDQIEQYFHITPFGAAARKPSSKAIKFLPQYKSEGEFYIGLEKFDPSQSSTLSLLFQILEGSEEPEAEKSDISWSYLSNNQWIPFEQFDILAEGTNELLTSGIVNFSVSKSATRNNTVLTDGLHWIKVSVSKGTEAIPEFVDVLSQAVIAQFQDNKNDPNYLSAALANESISKLEISDSAIDSVSQPFASFGGNVKEQSNLFYRRISERLRHKQRAITIWDYERIALEAFPSIYKAKCLNHTRFLGKIESFNQVAPGHTTVIVVSNVQNKNSVNLIQPKASLNLLTEIQDYLDQYNPPGTELHVQNPIYEQIQVNFKVKFRPGFDLGFYKRKLEDEIKAFLSPWAYDQSPDIVFGGKIHQSMIIDFVDERPYVDYVISFKMYHKAAKEEPLAEATATTSASVLCSIGQVNSYGDHVIEVLEKDIDCDLPSFKDNIVDPPSVVLSKDECRSEEEEPEPNGEDPYEYSSPDPELCPEPEQIDECEDVTGTDPKEVNVLTDSDNEEYFIKIDLSTARGGEEDDDDDDRPAYQLTLKELNMVYLLPTSVFRMVNLDVTEITGDKSLKVVGDVTGFKNKSKRIVENTYRFFKDPDRLNIKEIGDFKDGQTSIEVTSKIKSKLQEGDHINISRNTGNQFCQVYLPQLTQQMVEDGAWLKLQIVTDHGQNISLLASRENGKDRLQALGSSSTTRSSVRLNNDEFSCSLLATAFNPRSGYNDCGWKVIAENENYYQECVDANLTQLWEDRFLDEYTSNCNDDDDDD